jgi:hypothetical protein
MFRSKPHCLFTLEFNISTPVQTATGGARLEFFWQSGEISFRIEMPLSTHQNMAWLKGRHSKRA